MVGNNLFSITVDTFSDGDEPLTCYEYSLSQGQRLIAQGGSKRAFYSLTNYNDSAVFIIGGQIASQHTKSVLKLDLRSEKFIDIAPMNMAREFHGSTTTGDILAIIGGQDNHGLLSSIEILNVLKEGSKWQFLHSKLPMPRKYPLVSEIRNDQIVICGGRDPDGELLGDILIFNTRSCELTESSTSTPYQLLCFQNSHTYKWKEGVVLAHVFIKDLGRSLVHLDIDSKLFTILS